MINLSTKFEVSVHPLRKDERQHKMLKWSGFGRLGVIQGHRQHNHLTERIRLPIDFNRNCVYRVPFSSYNQLFVKSRRLQPTPPAFGAPLLVTPFKFRQDLWYQKTRVPGLS